MLNSIFSFSQAPPAYTESSSRGSSAFLALLHWTAWARKIIRVLPPLTSDVDVELGPIVASPSSPSQQQQEQPQQQQQQQRLVEQHSAATREPVIHCIFDFGEAAYRYELPYTVFRRWESMQGLVEKIRFGEGFGGVIEVRVWDNRVGREVRGQREWEEWVQEGWGVVVECRCVLWGDGKEDEEEGDEEGEGGMGWKRKWSVDKGGRKSGGGCEHCGGWDVDSDIDEDEEDAGEGEDEDDWTFFYGSFDKGAEPAWWFASWRRRVEMQRSGFVKGERGWIVGVIGWLVVLLSFWVLWLAAFGRAESSS